MNEENMKKFHPELAEYYQKGDCCTWIVDLRKQVSEKDKEINQLNNIINELEVMIFIKLQRDYHERDYRINTGDLKEIYDILKELKESGNNEQRNL